MAPVVTAAVVPRPRGVGADLAGLLALANLARDRRRRERFGAEPPPAVEIDLCKDAYGAKAKDIADQYAKYVPPEFVPDRFELPTRGCTGTSNVWKQTTLSSRASTEATARSTQAVHAREGQPADASAGQALKKVRWSSAVHTKPLAQALMARPFNKTLPKNLSEWVALAGKMPAPGEGEQWDVMTLKRHAKATLKSSSGVTH